MKSGALCVSDFEFYETPDPFTIWLFRAMADAGHAIKGELCEPCVGSGAIPRAVRDPSRPWLRSWFTNDIDPRWQADHFQDAATPWGWSCDWTVTNPPFSLAIDIAEQALASSHLGVAMHLRASIHEVTKTGRRRTWMADHPPTAILWLPRFAYQRSKTTGEWTTDSVTCCWVVWVKGVDQQFIRYAPASVLDELKRYEPEHRRRMDELSLVRSATAV